MTGHDDSCDARPETTIVPTEHNLKYKKALTLLPVALGAPIWTQELSDGWALGTAGRSGGVQ
jgi:hypothetical protein